MRIFLILVGLLWFGALVLQAADRYVVVPGTPGGTNTGPFTDWTIAATQIQWAVDVATIANDTVWVSNGMYVLTNQIVVTNAITLRSTNGPNVTVINGNFVAGSETTNNRCLWMSNASAFVSGFTFSNGAVINQNGAGVWMYKGILSNCYMCNNTIFAPPGSSPLGGGIYMWYATVTVCRIYGNLVTNLDATGYGEGAGITFYIGLVSDCVISNNLVAGGVLNSSHVGGGVIVGSGTIRSSIICNNSIPQGFAGGIFGDNLFMEDCTVYSNNASYVGGILLRIGTITNCVISNNVSAGYGGGVYLNPNSGDCYCYVYNTTIVGNSPEGVIMMPANAAGRNANKIVQNCIIENNTGYGVWMQDNNIQFLNSTVRGTIGLGVGIYDFGTMRNCLIYGNSNNAAGAGLWISSACNTVLVSCCTITSNRSTSAAGSGIRIEATAANDLSISSCIIYSNGVSGANDVFDAASPTNIGAIQYSCVGSNSGFTGAGIIVADPQFKDFAGGNYRLAANSPCINTGSNETWMTNAYDLDGRTRIRYGRVDMGAYERINNGSMYGFH